MINSPHFGDAALAVLSAAKLAVFTTDPRLLIALTAVATSVGTVAFCKFAVRYALRDDDFTGRHEYMADAPHVAGSPGSLYFAGMGAAHGDRSTCAVCDGPCPSDVLVCRTCDDTVLPPADRFSRGVA